LCGELPRGAGTAHVANKVLQEKETKGTDMNFIGNESAQKLRGGYYTPLDLAVFIARWVKQIAPKRILEPSCGDGIFFDAISRSGINKQTEVVGFELNSDEAAKSYALARAVGLKKATVYDEDFLAWALTHLDNVKSHFDAIVGNPPFVRYQYLPEPFQICAEQIFEQLNLHFTKHTNAWVPFVLSSLKLLNPGGRLAMIVPAEIMHVIHAQSLRTYLGQECRRLVVIDPEELWFDGTLQGAVILLAEKRHHANDKAEGLGMYPVKGREFLDLDPGHIFAAPQSINGQTVQGKWTRALLDTETRNLIDELMNHPYVHLFDDVAKVDVGIVTGANKYFLVTDEVVRRYQLGKWAHPMFGRSEHCPGVIYDERQHKRNAKKGSPTNFLWFQDKLNSHDTFAKTYIKLGEAEEFHTRYKCRIRAPWYSVPSVYATEIGMLKRSHNSPRLILNRLGAYTTDTAYRIRATVSVTPAQLVWSFINPLTALSAELEGRHYGGGVLELVPSEIERLVLPLPKKVKVSLKNLDKDIRTKPTQQVLSQQGKIILGGLGLSKAKQEKLLGGWKQLRDRRHRTSSDAETGAA
jgi:adenine-specific DNA-methyltransferase